MTAPLEKGALAEDVLRDLDGRLDRALSGERADLTVLGYGEISTVLLVRTASGDFACKRLPPFPDEAALVRYREAFDAYLDRLRAGGVTPVESTLSVLDKPAGPVAWCVQPAASPRDLLPARLAELSNGAASGTAGAGAGAAASGEAGRLLDAVVAGIEGVVDGRTGLDAQLSNWIVRPGGLAYLDVNTPMMRDARGAEVLDLSLFLKAIPAVLRPLVRRFFLSDILDKYYVPRGAVLDLLGNMHKERLDALIPAFVERVADRFDPPLTEREVRRYYRGDARMWALLQAMRRLDRLWQQKVRRRGYHTLLPGRIRR